MDWGFDRYQDIVARARLIAVRESGVAALGMVEAEIASELSPDLLALFEAYAVDLTAGSGNAVTAAERLAVLESSIIPRVKGEGDCEKLIQMHLLSARGLIELSTAPAKSREYFEEALTLSQMFADKYQQARILTHLGSALSHAGDSAAALNLLDRAAEVLDESDVDADVKRALVEAHRYNRSLIQERRRGWRERAHKVLRPLGRRHQGNQMLEALGTYQLAEDVFSKGRYGAALRIAQDAERELRRMGNHDVADASLVVGLSALVKLRRLEGVEEELVALCAKPNAKKAFWWPRADDLRQEVLRQTGRLTDPNEIIGDRAVRSALDRVFALLELDTREIFAGRKPSRESMVIEETERVEALHGKEAPELVDVIRAIVDLVYRRETSFKPDAEMRLRLLALDADPDLLTDVFEMFKSVMLDDVNAGASVALRQVALDQLRLSRQDRESDRALFVAGAMSSIEQALSMVVRQEDWAALFELLEFTRRDISERKGDSELIEFVESDVSQVEGMVLGDPRSMKVKGRSALANAATWLDSPLEADEIRKGLAGGSSCWLTLRLTDRNIYGALIYEEGVAGSVLPLSDDFRMALRRHAEHVPLVTAWDLEIAGEARSGWIPTTVAIARVASSEMLFDERLVEQCFSALPRAVAVRLRRALRPSTNVMGVYDSLGRDLLALLERLPQPVETVVISVPPELATVPFALLGTQNGECLIERHQILFAPPGPVGARIATRVRPAAAELQRLDIIDPAGDLRAARLSDADGATRLGSWHSARLQSEVATANKVSRSLACLGAPTALAYVGHIEPGTNEAPGAAALVCAADTPSGPSTRLTARELVEIGESLIVRAHLGACEGTGFGTGLEWSSVAAALLGIGARTVTAQAWPIVDSPEAAAVDEAVIRALMTPRPGETVRRAMLSWLEDWRRDPSAAPPHFWAGLSIIGSGL